MLHVTVHPAYAYVDRAVAAARREHWAEAAFWLGEVLRECPCIPDVPRMLVEARTRLGLRPDPQATPCCGGCHPPATSPPCESPGNPGPL